MLATRSTNCQPVMLGFIQPKTAGQINTKSGDFYYDYKKQIAIQMGGNCPAGKTLPNPNGTRRRLGSGAIQYDTTYGD